MTRNRRGSNDGEELRRQAEQKLRERGGSREASLGADEIAGVLHDLRVHQVELEMQNDELRRAQASLVAERGRYFDLFEQAPVGYLTLNSEGTILEANLTAASILGLSRSEVMGRPLTSFISPDDQDVYYLHRRRVESGAAPEDCEVRIVQPGDVRRWVALSTIAAREPDGTPVVRAVMVDITARRNAEDELEQSRARVQETQTLEAVGRLAGGVAHSFNNLLQALLSLSALLRLHSTTHESSRIIDQIDLLCSRGADLAQQLFHLQSHDGRIDVESAVGKKNVFRFFLPTSTPPSRVSVSETSCPELIRGNGEQILLVEDEDATRESLAELLGLLGYSVRAARSAEEALELAPAVAPDLLLSDVLLPGIDGTVLAERLQARWPGMRVILMSGYTSDIVVPGSVAGEPVRFVRKPFEMAAMSRELRAALDSR